MNRDVVKTNNHKIIPKIRNFNFGMKLIHQILNVMLAFLLVLSTTGLALHKHYCMGEVKDVAINHHAQSCTGNMDMESESGCCQNTVDLFKTDDFNKSGTEIGFDIYKTPVVITYLLIDQDLFSVSAHFTQYLNYKPPLINLDIPVLIQSFLL